jgi:uncharacterized protein (TIGR03086 family)
MTNTTTTRDAAPPALPDLRPQIDRALTLAERTLRAVRADQLELPTPCTELDVRSLASHLVFAVRRLTVVGLGEHFSSVSDQHDISDDALVVAFSAAAGELREVWADDALLDRPLTFPFGTVPGRVAIGIYLGEVSTHTWDLAVATGQRPDFDDAIVEVALAVARVGIPADRDGIPFDPAQPVAHDAAAIERLVAWEGRNPAWRAGVA